MQFHSARPVLPDSKGPVMTWKCRSNSLQMGGVTNFARHFAIHFWLHFYAQA
jgi:hypothetical protein